MEVINMNITFGYGRVSTEEQHEERQIEAIKKYRPSIKPENIFIDKQTGKEYDRPQYNALKLIASNIIKAYGDEKERPLVEVVIEELDRVGRTKQGILEELRWFAENHIRVRILEIPTTLMDIDPQNDWVLDMINKILIEVYASLAEQEMEKRTKRQREGIEQAKLRGVYKGRKPITVDKGQFELVYKRWKSGELTALKAMDLLNLKTNTFYRMVKQYEENNVTIFSESTTKKERVKTKVG